MSFDLELILGEYWVKDISPFSLSSSLPYFHEKPHGTSNFFKGGFIPC